MDFLLPAAQPQASTVSTIEEATPEYAPVDPNDEIVAEVDSRRGVVQSTTNELDDASKQDAYMTLVDQMNSGDDLDAALASLRTNADEIEPGRET